MKRRPIGIGAAALAALVLAVIGIRHDRPAPPRFALASASITLPDDAAAYPAGPHADAVDAHCTACHSASMVTNQPPLTADQWQAEVTKMREVYKAPIPDDAVPAILAYLTAMPAPAARRSE